MSEYEKINAVYDEMRRVKICCFSHVALNTVYANLTFKADIQSEARRLGRNESHFWYALIGLSPF